MLRPSALPHSHSAQHTGCGGGATAASSSVQQRRANSTNSSRSTRRYEHARTSGHTVGALQSFPPVAHASKSSLDHELTPPSSSSSWESAWRLEGAEGLPYTLPQEEEGAPEQDDVPRPLPRKVIQDMLVGAGTLPELLHVVRKEAPRMDGVNAAHALYRLAKLVGAYTGSMRRAKVPLSEVMPAAWDRWVAPCLAMLSSMLAGSIRELEARDVASSLWACAAIGHYDRGLFDLLCNKAVAVLPSMRPVDCANIMVAFARFGHYHPEVLRMIPQVLLVQIYETKPYELSQVLWGYGRLRVPGAPGKVFLEAATDALHTSMEQFGPQELSNMLWAFVKLHHYPGRAVLHRSETLTLRRLIHSRPRSPHHPSSSPYTQPPTSSAVTQQQQHQHQHQQQQQEQGGGAAAVSDLRGEALQGSSSVSMGEQGGDAAGTSSSAGRVYEALGVSDQLLRPPSHPLQPIVPQDIGNLLWAFGKLHYKSARLLDELPYFLGPWLHEFQTADICSVLTGYTHARHYHKGVMEAFAPLLMARVHTLNVSELVITLWSYGIFQHRPLSEPRFLDAISAALARQLRPGTHTQTYAVVMKAYANLRYWPEPVLTKMVENIESKISSFPPDEMAALLYGLSHLAASRHIHQQEEQRLLAQAAASASSSNGSSSSSSSSSVNSIWPGGRPAGAGSDALRSGPWAATPNPRMQPTPPASLLPQQPGMADVGPVLSPPLVHLFHSFMRQCMRIMEESSSSPAAPRMHYKVLNSIVFSCLRVGQSPWMLVDYAESRGIRLIQPGVAMAKLNLEREITAQAAVEAITGMAPTTALTGNEAEAVKKAKKQPGRRPRVAKRRMQTEATEDQEVQAVEDAAEEAVASTAALAGQAAAATSRRGGVQVPPPRAPVTLPGEVVGGLSAWHPMHSHPDPRAHARTHSQRLSYRRGAPTPMGAALPRRPQRTPLHPQPFLNTDEFPPAQFGGVGVQGAGVQSGSEAQAEAGVSGVMGAERGVHAHVSSSSRRGGGSGSVSSWSGVSSAPRPRLFGGGEGSEGVQPSEGGNGAGGASQGQGAVVDGGVLGPVNGSLASRFGARRPQAGAPQTAVNANGGSRSPSEPLPAPNPHPASTASLSPPSSLNSSIDGEPRAHAPASVSQQQHQQQQQLLCTAPGHSAAAATADSPSSSSSEDIVSGLRAELGADEPPRPPAFNSPSLLARPVPSPTSSVDEEQRTSAAP